MSHTEIVEITMPDGTVINAEVLVSNSITDAGAQGRRLSLVEAKESVTSFVHWAVSGLGIPAAAGTSGSQGLDSWPAGMTLGRIELEFGLKLMVKGGMLASVVAAVGGEATAVVRLEWERARASGGAG